MPITEEIRKLALKHSSPKDINGKQEITAPQIAQGLWQAYGH